MRANIFVAFCVMMLAVSATQSQPMAAPSEEASLLMTALCLHDNRIRESCLHNARTREFINALLLTLSSSERINVDHDESDDENNGQKIVATPDKRRRPQDQLSGFYSNW
ncbi:uncharacterized protein LOC143277826 [Babylonia areolata]|uniref:uncharacterized protein LOC143277826 n=1 Tax=Babylonia areolata TaxID=304850 RepID=UPI003FD4870F